MQIDPEKELWELRGLVPEATQNDFYELENGNIAALLQFDTSKNDFSQNEFEILIE